VTIDSEIYGIISAETKAVKNQGHAGTIYIDKIRLNSVPADPINYILRGWHQDDPPCQ